MKTGLPALFTTIAEINKQRAQSGKLYREFLRVPAMSAGVYVLPVGATDLQRPHQEDEMYYVVKGRARFHAGDQDQDVAAGSVLFVAAEVEHHFYDVVDEITLLVFFAPAES